MAERLSQTDLKNQLMHFAPGLLQGENSVYDLLKKAQGIIKNERTTQYQIFSITALSLPGDFPVMDLTLFRGISDIDRWNIHVEMKKEQRNRQEGNLSIGGYVRLERDEEERKQKPELFIAYGGTVLRPFESNDSDVLYVNLATSSQVGKEMVIRDHLKVHSFALVNKVNSGSTVSYPVANLSLDQLADQEKQGMIEVKQIDDPVKIHEIEHRGGFFAFKYTGFPAEGNTGAIRIPSHLDVRVR